jgi:hypothetical protein
VAVKTGERYCFFSPTLFKNIMDFSTGELTFRANYRRSNFGKKVSVDTTATEITCYQYLGMAKILVSSILYSSAL